MKKHLRFILGIIVGALLSGTIVYAAITAVSVDYSNQVSGLKDANGNDVTNVQDAIDVLSRRANGFNSLIQFQNGSPIPLGGYNWHIIGQDENNMYLLMDDGQLSNMNACTNDTNASTDCGVYNTTYYGGYPEYSWEKSRIRAYLNGEFYNSLPANIKDNLVETEICKDPSHNSDNFTYSYGGYTKGEIEELVKNNISATCSSGYTSDKVRLISMSEYYNLTNYYSGTAYPITSVDSSGQGYYPYVSYITRLDANNWLYQGLGVWWTMTASVRSCASCTQLATAISSGEIYQTESYENKKIRPVIVIRK